MSIREWAVETAAASGRGARELGAGQVRGVGMAGVGRPAAASVHGLAEAGRQWLAAGK